jgi:hypothetical protein
MRLIFEDSDLAIRMHVWKQRTRTMETCAAPPELTPRLNGGRIEPARTARRVDPQAVTFHRFIVASGRDDW